MTDRLPSGITLVPRVQESVYNDNDVKLPESREVGYIRLLELYPSENYSDGLRGKLFITSLNGHCNYTALSYTWEGAPTSIVINDVYTLDITNSLENALRQFRLPNRSLVLWIDSICINQGDEVEKGVQVSMMAEIDKNASQLWIWLGKAAQDSVTAISLLNTLADKSFENDDIVRLREVDVEVWIAIGHLMSRRWWTRKWVIQEALLSKNRTVRCGSAEIPLMKFANLERLREECWEPNKVPLCRQHVPSQPFTIILENWEMTNMSLIKKPSLYSWMPDTNKFECSQDLDKFYALLGLSDDFSREQLPIDYTLTVDQLLTRASALFLREQQRLLPLQMCQTNKNMHLQVPSWVSDWFSADQMVNLVFQEDEGKVAYNSCGPYTRTVPSFTNDYRRSNFEPKSIVLNLQGVIFAAIVSAVKMPSIPRLAGCSVAEDLVIKKIRADLTRSTLMEWECMVDRLADQDDPYKEGHGGRREAFLRTVTADRDFHWHNLPDGNVVRRQFEAWKANSGDDDPMLFRYPAITRCNARSLVVTSKGYLGLAPAASQPGDLVCVLCGGDVPFVLRIEGDGYKFIGESFIYGIMDGSVMASKAASEFMEFRIK